MVRLRYASSGVPWPFRQQTWGVISTVFLSSNLGYKQSNEHVTLQAPTGQKADLSWASADQAVVPLGCSHLCLVAKSTGPENQPGMRPAGAD